VVTGTGEFILPNRENTLTVFVEPHLGHFALLFIVAFASGAA
jgi:hypothetical protein